MCVEKFYLIKDAHISLRFKDNSDIDVRKRRKTISSLIFVSIANKTFC